MPSSFSAARRPSSAGATGILLVAFFVCLYTLSYSGTFRVDDEHILAARSQSLALWGRLEEPQVYGNSRVRELAAFGDPATQIEPLQSVIGAALYRLGIGLDLGGAQALFALNVYGTALAAGCVYAAILCLGLSPRAALWSALLFGGGTMAWPYAATFYRDSLAMAGASVAFLGWSILVGGRGRPSTGAALLVFGVVAGVLTKNTIVAALPAFAIATFAIAVGGLRSRSGSPWKALGAVSALAVAGLIAAASLSRDGSLARFSLAYYVSLARHFVQGSAAEILPALAGPFLSPAKSILLFSPPLLVAIAGILGGWRKTWKVGLPALVFALFLAAGQALFYRERWAGTFAWGLRSMLPALPALMIGGAPAIEWLAARQSRFGRAALPGVLALSAVVQLGGSWVDLRPLYDSWLEAGLDPYGVSAAWQARFLAIPGQIAGMLSPSSWSVAWMRLLREGAREAILAPLAAAGAGAAIAIALARANRAPGTVHSAVPWLLAAVAAGLPIFPTLWAYQKDPEFAGDRPEFAQALTSLSMAARTGDWIVLDAYGTPLWAYWMNRWDEPLRWHALPFEIPGSPGVTADVSCPLPPMTLELLFDTPREGDRLFYLTSPDSPDYALGRETCRLDSAYDLETSETFGSTGAVEIRTYRVR